jgi:hypothetical protein
MAWRIVAAIRFEEMVPIDLAAAVMGRIGGVIGTTTTSRPARSRRAARVCYLLT